MVDPLDQAQPLIIMCTLCVGSSDDLGHAAAAALLALADFSLHRRLLIYSKCRVKKAKKETSSSQMLWAVVV